MLSLLLYSRCSEVSVFISSLTNKLYERRLFPFFFAVFFPPDNGSLVWVVVLFSDSFISCYVLASGSENVMCIIFTVGSLLSFLNFKIFQDHFKKVYSLFTGYRF